MPGAGNYVSVDGSPFALRRATLDNLGEVLGLIEEAVEWLRRTKNTDQWATPWPDLESSVGRLRNDLRQRKTWLVWDDTSPAGTITLDTQEPVDVRNRPVWPAYKRHELALYVRRVIASRRYAGLELGARLLDWASEVAMRDYGATLIRIDVWTTNLELHEYYERQRFIRRRGREPWELANYPSQALFERAVDQAGSGHTELFTQEGRPGGRQPLYRTGRNISYLR
jgi:hypothetical protein